MIKSITYTAVMGLLLTSCSHHSHEGTTAIPHISTEMASKSGSKVSGDLEFTQKSDGVKLVVNLKGLSKNSTHGFHIHQTGDCSSADAKSAGGHFNPENHNHGAPNKKETHHFGDLGNVKSNSRGSVSKTIFIPRAMLGGSSKLSILDRAVIIHKKNDDFSSQPSGNAGPRIGCAVIKPRTN